MEQRDCDECDTQCWPVQEAHQIQQPHVTEELAPLPVLVCFKGQDVPAKQQHDPIPGHCTVESPGAGIGAQQDVWGRPGATVNLGRMA